MGIFYRFPVDSMQRESWIKAINDSNDSKYKCVGTGMVCSLHFKPHEITKKKGRLNLIPGTIPSIFVPHNEKSNTESNSVTSLNEYSDVVYDSNPNKKCNKCEISMLDLETLKRNCFDIQTNFDIELQKKNIEIKRLTSKYDDSLLEICDLKRQINSLQKTAGEMHTEKNKLEERILQVMNASDIKVIDPLLFIMLHSINR